MKIPRCMSTQHPDNVNTPFFVDGEVIGGEAEIKEVFYAFSHLGCDEQMWDHEGKEVDNYVVRKLLTSYEDFFREKILGQDVFITLRVPNPLVEKAEAKILLETLESIPRSYDTARLFYGKDIVPIFEVILPMTSSSKCLDRIYHYYIKFIIDRQYKKIIEDDINIADWIGEFAPQKINVIPLFEDMQYMLAVDKIMEEYLQDKRDIYYQRVFLARSDLAMNYGFISAVLANKIALNKLQKLSNKVGKQILPIIGIGSAPFRGNLKPATVERIMQEYPSVHTFTIQSSFKYDYPLDEVREAIGKINRSWPTGAEEIEEARAMEIINKYYHSYREHIYKLAPIINRVARYVPQRRLRKLHIGLFGYARNMEGINLPRAISFVCALYSIGLPPELLALEVLNREDIAFIKSVYKNFEKDLADVLQYSCPDKDYWPDSIRRKIDELGVNINIDEDYEEKVKYTIQALKQENHERIREGMLLSAYRRRFLG